jgi:membrane protease YdiL (CAAX protease family)
MNMKILKKDSMLLGIIIGLILPALLFAVLYFPSRLFAPLGKDYLVQLPTLALISIFPNLFTFRHYLKILKLDQTGRGILLVTFVFAILYFAFYPK